MRSISSRLLMIAAVLSLFVAACGDDGGDAFAVGADAPAFELPESRGGTVALGDFASEPVLLYFHMAEG